MVSFCVLSVAALAGFAATTPLVSKPLPVLENSLSPRQDSNNCTNYCSPSAGCVCQRRPSDCEALYFVKPDDTCGSIASLFNNFTQSIFYYWNPDIGPSCFGLRAFAPVCINTPWYTFTPPVVPAVGSVVGNSVPTEQPIPLAPFITADDCNKFELAGDGVGVAEMEAKNGLNDTLFYAWNGGVNQTNPGLWAGYFYCVGVSGS